MAEEEYVPDAGDWNEWDELMDQERQWNRKTFSVIVNGVEKSFSRERFIERLRKAIVINIKDYKTKTRRELITILDRWFQVKEELRRYCDLSESDFERMLDEVSFPYLNRAWNSMFHKGLLEDIEEDRRILRELNKSIQPEGDKPVEQQNKTEEKPKTTKKNKKASKSKKTQVEKPVQSIKEVLQEVLPEAYKTISVQKKSSKYRKSLSYLELDTSVPLTFDELIKRISQQCQFDRHISRMMTNNIKILLLRQELQMTYGNQPILLSEFVKLCELREISPVRMDGLFGTKRLMTNILTKVTKGSTRHRRKELQQLFRHMFDVELAFD